MDETHAQASLPGLDIDIRHRRESASECVQITWRATPGLGAFTPLAAHRATAAWIDLAFAPWRAWLRLGRIACDGLAPAAAARPAAEHANVVALRPLR